MPFTTLVPVSANVQLPGGIDCPAGTTKMMLIRLSPFRGSLSVDETWTCTPPANVALEVNPGATGPMAAPDGGVTVIVNWSCPSYQISTSSLSNARSP